MLPELAEKFKALGDANRLAIFDFIRCCGASVGIDEGSGECSRVSETCVGDICCRFDVAPSTVSHHLKELRNAGLIDMERRGRWVFVSANAQTLHEIMAFLGQPVSAAENAECTIAMEK